MFYVEMWGTEMYIYYLANTTSFNVYNYSGLEILWPWTGGMTCG